MAQYIFIFLGPVIQLFEAILCWNLLYTFPHSFWTSGNPGHILCLWDGANAREQSQTLKYT